jgi:hypothetical protein
VFSMPLWLAALNGLTLFEAKPIIPAR